MKTQFSFFILLGLICHLSQAQNDSLTKASVLSSLSLEELMNINVVTASKVKQKVTEAPATMMIITAKQIKERGYQRIEDVLADIPGVDLIHANAQASTFITFRGMYGDENRRILFMIDGIAENNLIGNYEIAGPAYSLHNVAQIEIIMGPASSLYGANAYGGIINIITKTGEAINGFQFQRGYGSNNTSVEDAMLGIKKSNIDLALSGSLYNTDGLLLSNRHPRYNNSYVKNA